MNSLKGSKGEISVYSSEDKHSGNITSYVSLFTVYDSRGIGYIALYNISHGDDHRVIHLISEA